MKIVINIDSVFSARKKIYDIKSLCPSCSLLVDDLLDYLGLSSALSSNFSSDLSIGDLVTVEGNSRKFYIRKLSLRNNVLCAFVVPVSVSRPFGFWVECSNLRGNICAEKK